MIFLIVLTIIVGAVAAGLTIARVVNAIYSRKVFGLPHKDTKGVSWAGRQVLRAYHKVPENHRPYGNILNMVKAMDTYANKDVLDKHTVVWGYDYDTSGWCKCDDNCMALQYKELESELDGIVKDLEQQHHALQQAGVSATLDEADEFMNAVRRERNLINETTKELTS